MTIASVDPTTGTVRKEFAAHTPAEVEDRIAAAQTAFRELAGTTFAQRAAWLHRTADLLGRGVGGAQVGQLLLQLLQTTQLLVELGVGQRRVVEHVVAPARLLDLLGQDPVLLTEVGGRVGSRGLGGRRRSLNGWVRLAHGPILPCSDDTRSTRRASAVSAPGRGCPNSAPSRIRTANM